MMRYPRIVLGVVAVFAVGALTAGVRGLARTERRTEDADGVDGVARPGERPPSGNSPARTDNRPRAEYRAALIRNVPHIRQKPDFCGEACAAMILNRLGQPVDQDWVFDQSGLDPREARGCYTKELATALTRIGFKIGPVWHKVPARQPAEKLESLWKELHADLVAGIPSIVCMYFDDQPKTTEHFRLVLGYDARTDEVLYHDPAEERGAYLRMRRAKFLELWPLKSSADEWTAIRLRLEPGQLKPGKAATTFTGADYAQHLMELKKKLPGPEFAVVIQPPFVVIGDEPAKDVQSHAERTVKWAVDRLKEAYFTKDPAEILDIWLFKDKTSYDKYCRTIFKQAPTTPYGYYSHVDKALVMNIATGGGTLVHEIVHPFMAANFPDCPAWFNEGMGSLYEQCGDENGLIHGYTNWRLAGLQEAIRAKRLPSFKTLCTTTDGRFYNDDRGTNYAQARYLCYYLQEQGLLQKFYHQFVSAASKEPSGYETLKKILGRDDEGMNAFQREWETFVLKLRFP